MCNVFIMCLEYGRRRLLALPCPTSWSIRTSVGNSWVAESAGRTRTIPCAVFHISAVTSHWLKNLERKYHDTFMRRDSTFSYWRFCLRWRAFFRSHISLVNSTSRITDKNPSDLCSSLGNSPLKVNCINCCLRGASGFQLAAESNSRSHWFFFYTTLCDWLAKKKKKKSFTFSANEKQDQNQSQCAPTHFPALASCFVCLAPNANWCIAVFSSVLIC